MSKSTTQKVAWNLLFPVMQTSLFKFASGEVSGRALYSEALRKNVGPEVRRLLRPGVNRARALARKALSRRGRAVTTST